MDAIDELTAFIEVNLRGRKTKKSVTEIVEGVKRDYYRRQLDKVFAVEGYRLAGFDMAVAGETHKDDIWIAYSKKHKGLFPFPHDHCYTSICSETHCLEIEYPCNVDWPWPFVFAN